MQREREALRALLALVRREAPHLSGKVVGDAEAALASPPAADLTDDQIDACVGNLGMAPYSVLAGPDEIRKFARKLLAEQAFHPQAQVVAQEADMFWLADDGECFGFSLEELLESHDPGQVVRVSQAKSLPIITVRVLEGGACEVIGEVSQDQRESP